VHPINEIRSSQSSKLEGKRIVLGITASIAAVECVKLARELARHGAEVIPVMSASSVNIIHPDSIHFATGNEPIIELDGAVKHVELCGESKGRADLLLIAPATANTISKIAAGVDDTSVTTMASCALGSEMPVVIVPAMHTSMYTHDIIKDNIKLLKRLGVAFVGPVMEENKAKMALLDDVVRAVMRILGPADLKKNKVLVITGSTREPIDDVRCITNYSSGRTGIEIALEAHRRGAEVDIWAANGVAVPGGLVCKRFSSVGNLEKMARRSKADVIVVPAAISDFSVEKGKGKLSSSDSVSLTLQPAKKILKVLRENNKGKIIGFKAEVGVSDSELEKKARGRMKEYGLDMVVANLLDDVDEDYTKALILFPGKKAIKLSGTKTELAEKMFDALAEC
jgi:phosphopantothenoylcysteine decarboxylase/phosphopantothenate--cysteine ligase